LKLYFFASKNTTNIWAGYGARMWAVSADAEDSMTKAWKTKARAVRVGQAGVIYRSQDQVFTMPFLFASVPAADREVDDIWPERWVLPFSIYPLGSPHRTWRAREALGKLEVFRATQHPTLNDFYVKATQSFTPMEIPESDWGIFLQHLAEVPSSPA
jgi:hypothetical protein